MEQLWILQKNVLFAVFYGTIKFFFYGGFGCFGKVLGLFEFLADISYSVQKYPKYTRPQFQITEFIWNFYGLRLGTCKFGTFLNPNTILFWVYIWNFPDRWSCKKIHASKFVSQIRKLTPPPQKFDSRKKHRIILQIFFMQKGSLNNQAI